MQIKLNVNLIDKNQIKEESYKRNDGSLVSNKVIMLESKTLREEKVIATSKDGTKQLIKTGFISMPDTKNPDGSYTKGLIIGDIQEWRLVNIEQSPVEIQKIDTGEIDPNDVPF